MDFKNNKTAKVNKTESAITQASPASKVGAFKINTDSFSGSLQDIVPSGMKGMIAEIGQGLGVNLTDPMSLTSEQVIEAKKIAAQLDEKIMCMKELAPCIMKFLSFQVSAAEFQAEIVVQAAKAKSKIDQAQAKAYPSFVTPVRV